MGPVTSQQHLLINIDAPSHVKFQSFREMIIMPCSAAKAVTAGFVAFLRKVFQSGT